jgi:DNA-binding MarR family transcriptional regulator
MNKDGLFKVADSLTDLLRIVQLNIFKENDLIKNFHCQNNGTKRCIDDLSLPASHIKVIFYLTEFNSSPISQIADNLNISKSNMTPIIDSLIGHELVNRYPDPNDRRILRVELTPKTYELLESFRIAICKLFVEKISALSDEEVVTLDSSISNLITIFKKF